MCSLFLSYRQNCYPDPGGRIYYYLLLCTCNLLEYVLCFQFIASSRNGWSNILLLNLPDTVDEKVC